MIPQDHPIKIYEIKLYHLLSHHSFCSEICSDKKKNIFSLQLKINSKKEIKQFFYYKIA